MSGSVADGQSIGLNLTEAEEQGRDINYGGMNLGKGGEKVLARTLDWYNLTAVSLIKVDVQGAEKLVFYGARETIRRNLPAVVYEDTDFTISTDMNATMHIPQEVYAFNITGELVQVPKSASSASRVRRGACRRWGVGPQCGLATIGTLKGSGTLQVLQQVNTYSVCCSLGRLGWITWLLTLFRCAIYLAC